MWEKAKCASSLKDLKFIIPRGIQDSSSLSKKEKIYQAWNCASASRQKRCIESASKWLKLRKTGEAKDPKKVHSIKRWKTAKKKKEKKKKKAS